MAYLGLAPVFSMSFSTVKRLRLKHPPDHADGDLDRNVTVETVAGRDHFCLTADPLFGEVPNPNRAEDAATAPHPAAAINTAVGERLIDLSRILERCHQIALPIST